MTLIQTHIDFKACNLPCTIIYLTLWDLVPKSVYLGSTLRLVIGQEVVVEFRTVELARKRLGRGGVGLGRKAVVGGCGQTPSASDSLWRLFTGAIDWRLLRETLVRKKVGLDRVLSSRRLGCRRATHISQKKALQYRTQVYFPFDRDLI